MAEAVIVNYEGAVSSKVFDGNRWPVMTELHLGSPQLGRSKLSRIQPQNHTSLCSCPRGRADDTR